jgi:hypothetical protein
MMVMELYIAWLNDIVVDEDTLPPIDSVHKPLINTTLHLPSDTGRTNPQKEIDHPARHLTPHSLPSPP